jgi:ribosomal-protein-alanine N-acetyltransferase
MTAPVLETPRLQLAPLAPGDRDALAALLRDPAVRRWLCDGKVLSDPEIDGIVAASAQTFARDRAGMFVARVKDTGEIAGIAGFRRSEIGGLELVVALWPAHQHLGLADEASRACLRFAFDTAKIPRIVAGADAPNAASLRLIARLGFQPVRDTAGAFGAVRWFALDRHAVG